MGDFGTRIKTGLGLVKQTKNGGEWEKNENKLKDRDSGIYLLGTQLLGQ